MVSLMPKTYVSRLKDFIDRKTTPPGLTTDDGIRYWQERLLLVFVFVGAVFGIFVYLPSVALSIKEDLWSVAVADTVIYAWVVILFFSRSIPFAVRAASVSLIGYILGMLLLLTIGPFGGGPTWLFAFPVMVAILLGLRMSLIALAVNAGTLIIIGILLQLGYMDWDYSTINPVEKWVVISLNFLLLNSIVTIAIALISGGIQDLLKRQKSMLESLEKYRTLLETTSEGYTLLNAKRIIIEVNEAFCKMLGYSQDEILGKTPFDLVDDENREIFVEQTSKISATAHRSYEITLKKKNGEDLYTYYNATTLRDKSGEVQGSFALITDITEKKKAEEERNRLAVAIEQSAESVFITDRDGKIQYVNPAFERLTGYIREEAIGKNPRILKSGKHDPLFYKQMWDTLTRGDTWHGRFINQKKDGSLYETEAIISPILDKSGKITNFVSIKRDITNEIELEKRLIHAQKMEAIGTLAGGVAHDLNNILGGLVSYPELLLLQLPEDSPLRKSILTIQKSGEKAAAVVQDLLTLARRGVVITDVVSLNDVISEYLKSPEHENLKSYHPGGNIETRLEKDVLNILGSSIHLSKTVMNLVSNAAEAMPEGGKLTVTTENRYIDRPIRGYDDVKEGDYVVLIVSDTGTGISSDDIDKIFEPFYTKKKMGRSGTGLGMAVVWGTVKDHNGYIDVQSTEGTGTTFTLYFPVTREKLPEDKSHLAIESYSGSGESILVIDDVKEQRKIASGMLKELGYSVVSVSSGEEAVEYLKTNKIDLLLLDMIMDPGMDGLDTYKKILELHPRQKAIIASGFSETDRVKEVQSLGAGAYIRKPLLLEKIGLAVKEELEK